MSEQIIPRLSDGELDLLIRAQAIKNSAGDRIKYIAQKFDRFYKGLSEWEIELDKVNYTYYEGHCSSCTEYGSNSFPVVWLSLSTEDLDKQIEVALETARERQAQAKLVEAERQKQAKLESEKKLYQQLKFKFEG